MVARGDGGERALGAIEPAGAREEAARGGRFVVAVAAERDGELRLRGRRVVGLVDEDSGLDEEAGVADDAQRSERVRAA